MKTTWMTKTKISLLRLTLAGQPVRVEKALIAQRQSLHTSAMPPFGGMLSPEQVADLVAWLLAQKPGVPKPLAAQ